jgi:hypothetical protein
VDGLGTLGVLGPFPYQVWPEGYSERRFRGATVPAARGLSQSTPATRKERASALADALSHLGATALNRTVLPLAFLHFWVAESWGSTGAGFPLREEKMGMLVFVCPAVGVEVSTGVYVDLGTLKSLEFANVYCPHCRQTHQMAGIRHWMATSDQLDNLHKIDIRAA